MDDFAPDKKAGLPVVTEVKEIVKEISHTFSSSSDPDVEERRIRVFKVKTPWYGMGALFAVIVLAVGQLLILVFADNKTNTQWPYWDSPNVCLSTLNNVSTLFLTYSIMNGIAIAWWRKAMGETSITKLHKSWAFSASFVSILREITHFNAIALAALMAKVAVIDGVLFQRAVGTEVRIPWNDTSRAAFDKNNLTLASPLTTFPDTGNIGRSQALTPEINADFAQTVWIWLSIGDGVNIYDYVGTCEGVGCVYNLTGVGFAIDCNEQNVTNTSLATLETSESGSATIFSVDWDWNSQADVSSKNYSSLVMNLILPLSDGTSCPTTFTNRQCEFRPAIVNYTVAYTNASSATLGDKSKDKSSDPGPSQNVGSTGSQLSYSCLPPSTPWTGSYYYDTGNCESYDKASKQVLGVNVVRELEVYESRQVGAVSKLGGILNVLRDQFLARAEVYYDNGSWSVAQTGSLAPLAMDPPPPDPSYCNYTYDDPIDLILTRLNTLMLMISTSYPTSEEDQDVTYVHAYQFYKHVYYTVDFKFAYIAISLTILVILCVLPTYYQFWVLGRSVTLGPLEIANAFRGPMFAEEQIEHHDFEKVLKAVGHKKLRYHPSPQPGQQPGFHTLP